MYRYSQYRADMCQFSHSEQSDDETELHGESVQFLLTLMEQRRIHLKYEQKSQILINKEHLTPWNLVTYRQQLKMSLVSNSWRHDQHELTQALVEAGRHHANILIQQTIFHNLHQVLLFSREFYFSHSFDVDTREVKQAVCDEMHKPAVSARHQNSKTVRRKVILVIHVLMFIATFFFCLLRYLVWFLKRLKSLNKSSLQKTSTDTCTDTCTVHPEQ